MEAGVGAYCVMNGKAPIVGLEMMIHGFDHAFNGFTEAYNGQATKTATTELLEKVGFPPSSAEAIDNGLS